MNNEEIELLYQDSVGQLEGNLSDIIDKLQKIKKKFTKQGYTNIKIEINLNSYKLSYSSVKITGVKKPNTFLTKLHKILSII